MPQVLHEPNQQGWHLPCFLLLQGKAAEMGMPSVMHFAVVP